MHILLAIPALHKRPVGVEALLFDVSQFNPQFDTLMHHISRLHVASPCER
jgi:hypothetical protein